MTPNYGELACALLPEAVLTLAALVVLAFDLTAGRKRTGIYRLRASVAIGPVTLFAHGVPHDDRATDAAAVLQQTEITVVVDLGTGGSHTATMWTCDFSAEYVRINADYRT